MGNQPTWGLWNNSQKNQHRNEEYALHDGGNSPGERSFVALSKGVVNPIRQEYPKIQRGQLHTDVWVGQKLSSPFDKTSKYSQNPLVAFGDHSACITGTVLLMKPGSILVTMLPIVLGYLPMPTPLTTLANTMKPLEVAAAWNMAPRIMIMTPTKVDFFRPSCSPKRAVATLPRKHPISYVATIRPTIVELGVWKVSLNDVVLTRPANDQQVSLWWGRYW